MSYTERDAKVRIADYIENKKWSKPCHTELECQAADSERECFFIDLEFMSDELLLWLRAGNIESTEQLAAWEIVAHAWRSWWPNSYDTSGLDEVFEIDSSVPTSIVSGPEVSDREPELKLTQVQAYAALEYWRAHMIEAVNKEAARHRAEIASRK